MFFGKKVTGPTEWLLVCLGNYGRQYENTRHNIGFMAAERLIDKRDLRCNRLRFRALTELIEFGGARVLLMMPQTYMNLSGEAVGEAARFYKIPSDHVLVIYDDVSLPLGKLRIRDKGSLQGTIVPVWDFWGTWDWYEPGDDAPDAMKKGATYVTQPMLTLNAIDGNVVSRMFGY